jgi:site-specific DNA recombinase
MRAAIYTRFSSDKQRAASSADQAEVCRRYVEQRGWTVARVYDDQAVSGGSRFRSSYQQLLLDAEKKEFDVLVCEALDRLARKLADIADLFDRLTFHGIQLHATAIGAVTPLHIGMLGTMSQLYLADLKEKTWRGQLGRALQGKAPGGKAYGYDVVAPESQVRKAERGHRRINEAEAAVVRRIFQEYAEGLSPRAIAKKLNAKGVPGPDGRPWGDTTLRGQVDRRTGILNNALYVGRLEWNRCSYVKDPRTGRRVARPNPPEKWETALVPELRIIDDDLWNKVKARQAEVRTEIGRDEHGNALNRARRRHFLLSGLLECGCCGGSYSAVQLGRYGCSAARSKGTCSNDRTVKREYLEDRVLTAVKGRLLAPDAIAEFMKECQAEVDRVAREAGKQVDALRRESDKVERKIQGIVRAIEDGMYNSSMKQRMTDLEARKQELAEALSAAEKPPAVRLHPKIAEIYRGKVAHLEEALADEAEVAQANDVIRMLIEKIVLTPDEAQPNELRIEMSGDLARILILCEAANTSRMSGPTHR